MLLVYRLPREPSAPRIAVWRKLRRLGVAQLADGLVALPLDARNKERLEWLADQVIENDGDATIWLADPASSIDQRAIVAKLVTDIANEYQGVVVDAAAAGALDPAARRRTLARLRRELARIRQRDYFPPPDRAIATQAIEELARQTEAVS
ncbi:MAG TPA: Chromate resistance protein ChrB [Actinomycetota bacterium]|nr:Chromate resistance protein ChrB [Actinomycetota bacterium]